MENKKCKGCEIEFPLDRKNFYIDRAQKDGFKNLCIACSKKKIRIRKVAKEGYKFCSKCKKELPENLDFFLKSDTTKNGLSSQCKVCRHEYYLSRQEYFVEKSRKYYRENKDVVSVKQKGYYQENKELKKLSAKKYYLANKETVRKYWKKYNVKNRSKLSKYQKEYYEKNKDFIAEVNKKWKKNNMDKVKLIRKRRRNKAKAVISDLTLEQWNDAKRYFGNKCSYCGEVGNLEQDHFIPVSKGGGYTKNNIVPSCRRCNASKNNFDFYDWYTKQSYYSLDRFKKIFNYLGVDYNE